MTWTSTGTVESMEQFRADQVAAVLARSRSVRRGVIACSSLDADDALREMSLVLAAGLCECRSRLEAFTPGDVPLRMLLSAERYWMEALLEIVNSPSSPADVLVAEVLASLPEDD